MATWCLPSYTSSSSLSHPLLPIHLSICFPPMEINRPWHIKLQLRLWESSQIKSRQGTSVRRKGSKGRHPLLSHLASHMKTKLHNSYICAVGLGLSYACSLVGSSISMSTYVLTVVYYTVFFWHILNPSGSLFTPHAFHRIHQAPLRVCLWVCLYICLKLIVGESSLMIVKEGSCLQVATFH